MSERKQCEAVSTGTGTCLACGALTNDPYCAECTERYRAMVSSAPAPVQPVAARRCKCGLEKDHPIHSFSTEWQQMHGFTPSTFPARENTNRYKATAHQFKPSAIAVELCETCGFNQKAHTSPAQFSTTSQPELIPCPFCGEDPVYLTDFEDDKQTATVHHVSCGLCRVQPGIYGRDSKEEAFKLWNARKVRLERDSLCAQHQAEYTQFTFSGCVACFVRDCNGSTPGDAAREDLDSLVQAMTEDVSEYFLDRSPTVDFERLPNIIRARLSRHFPLTEAAQVAVEAAAREICRELRLVKPTEEWFAAIISKHCFADTGEVERLRELLRDSCDTESRCREILKSYDKSDSLGVVPLDEVITVALTTAHANAIREYVAKIRAMGQQWYGEAKARGAAFSDKGRLAEVIAAALESKQEEDDGPTNG